MQNSRALVQCFQISRCLSSSSLKSSSAREGRFLNKMMQRTKKSKKIWHDVSMDLRNTMNIIKPVKSTPLSTLRRVAMRNKLFMEHITDQISMGKAAELISQNIEITHVEITPDFKIVKVFWIHTDHIPPSEELLERCAHLIRHELTQLRVIGIVPPIKFVKNKALLLQRTVEEKLEMIQSDLEISNSPLYSEEIKSSAEYLNKITNKQLNASNSSTTDDSETNDAEMDKSDITLPIMKHNVLGLDHHKIITRVITSMSKTKKAIQRRATNMDYDTNSNSQSDTTPNEVLDFLTKREQEKLFAEFLTKRRVEEKRKYRNKLQAQKSNEEVDSDYDDDNDNYDIEVSDDEFEGEVK